MDIGVPSGRVIGGRCVVLLMSFPAFCRSCHATSHRNRYSKWVFEGNSSFQWALPICLIHTVFAFPHHTALSSGNAVVGLQNAAPAIIQSQRCRRLPIAGRNRSFFRIALVALQQPDGAVPHGIEVGKHLFGCVTVIDAADIAIFQPIITAQQHHRHIGRQAFL